jgi:hypothetical protein
MLVSQLLVATFAQAIQKYPEVHTAWTQASWRLGGLLPNSLLTMCVQRDGWFDVVLRCMEDEINAGAHKDEQGQGHFQYLLSEMWVGGMYETLRLLEERELTPTSDESRTLAHDLRLLRVPLEKHEITSQGQLQQPLRMREHPPNNDPTKVLEYEYDKRDPRRSHIMPTGISHRGSVTWQLLDLKATPTERWIDRRDLSDRFLAIWSEPLPETPRA